MYLVQRGTWNKDLNNPELGLTGRNGVIDLDYMGSAEFEFGTVPYSMRRIMATYSERKLFNSGIKTPLGLTLWIYCKESEYDSILEEIKAFIEKPCRLKESISLREWITGEKHWRNENFWWNVENGEGDWMAFIGAADRKRVFINAIMNDFENWWMKMSEEERKDSLKKALSWR